MKTKESSLRSSMFTLSLALAAGAAGCSTTGTFRLPPDTKLYVYERPEPVAVDPAGKVETKPFFWSALGMPPTGGIPYRLEKDGQVVKQGRLRTKFRIVSIFWPPFAAIYWPMGFNPTLVYDLVNDTQLPAGAPAPQAPPASANAPIPAAQVSKAP